MGCLMLDVEVGAQSSPRRVRWASACTQCPPYRFLVCTAGVASHASHASQPDSKRRRHVDEKNCNHCQSDDELGKHGANVTQQTSPPGAASVNHTFARDDFTDNRANYWTNEQADQAEEQSD